MSDTVPDDFDSKEYFQQQAEEIKNRKGKNKNIKPTEVTVELPKTTSEQHNVRGRRKNSAHTPGRSNLPADVFGQHQETRDPAKIVEQREEKEEKNKK